MKLFVGAGTDIGRVRQSNQDHYDLALPEEEGGSSLFIVADGMGGHAGGEVASRIAVNSILDFLEERLGADNHEGFADLMDGLLVALRNANAAVYHRGEEEEALHGMGTTCVAALIREKQMAVAHAGDSRAYLMREGELLQLTEDHSLVQEYVRMGQLTSEEARKSRYRNVITKAVGLSEKMDPDVRVLSLEEGDIVLLCTDGLTSMLEDDEIGQVLASEPDVQRVCDSLINMANQRGGQDNITLIVVRAGEFRPSAMKAYSGSEQIEKATSSHSSSLVLFLLLFLIIAGMIVFSGVLYTKNRSLQSALRIQMKHNRAPISLIRDNSALLYTAPSLVVKWPLHGPVVCDDADNVLAVDVNGKPVYITPQGILLRTFSKAIVASRPGVPVFWAMSTGGYLYVCSQQLHAIIKYSPKGEKITIIGKGFLKSPESLAVDSFGDVYVIDRARLYVIRAIRQGEGNVTR
jgi:protein phosphatase